MSAGSPRRHNTGLWTLTGDDVITYDDADRLFVDPGGASRTITLPATKLGGFIQITNTADAAETITLNKPDDTPLLTISQGQTKSAICSGTVWYEVTGSGGASELSDLSDVGVTTPTNRNVLVADGDSWESRALVEADISDLTHTAANFVDASDSTAKSQVMLAPGNALTGDVGDNSVTGTWDALLQTGSLSVDTSHQPLSGNGAVTGEISMLTNNQGIWVDLSETVDATNQMYLAITFKFEIVVGPAADDHGPRMRVEVASDTGLTTVHSTQAFGSVSRGVYTTAICPLTSSSVRSAGIIYFDPLPEDDLARRTASSRIGLYIADVRLLGMSEAIVAMTENTGADVLRQPDYSPTVAEVPVPEIMTAQSTGFFDLRSEVRIISDFNGSKYIRQYDIDDTGTSDVTEELALIWSLIQDGDQVIFPHNGKFKYNRIGSGQNVKNGALELRVKKNVSFLFNGSTIYTDSDGGRRFDSILRFWNCEDIWIDKAKLIGFREDVIEGSVLDTVAGTPTVSGDDVELNAQDEEVAVEDLHISRDHNAQYAYDVVAWDTGQVADDLEWEMRTPDFGLRSSTHDGGATLVTLTDATVDTWDSGTGVMTFSTGDMVNDGVIAGMRVIEGAEGSELARGVIASVDSATQITLTVPIENLDFTVGDTVHIGLRDHEDQPIFSDSNARFRESDEIWVGDIAYNAAGEKAGIEQVWDTELHFNEAAVDAPEFNNGDTIFIYRRFGTGTLTLLASPGSTHQIRVTPSDQEPPVQLHLRKATATANTITIEEVKVYNIVAYSNTYEFAHGIALEDCKRVVITDCLTESLGGDGVFSSTPNNDGVWLIRHSSIGMGRQLASFNYGRNYYIWNPYFIKSARSGLDVEPFAKWWYVYNVEIVGGYIGVCANYGIAAENFHRVFNFRIEGVTYSRWISFANSFNGAAGNTDGFISGGGTRGVVTRNINKANVEMNIFGRQMRITNNLTHRLEVNGSANVVEGNMDFDGNNISVSINTDSIDTVIHNQVLSHETIYADSQAEPTFHPIRLGNNLDNSVVVSALTGKLGADYSSTFKGAYALQPENVWFPGGFQAHDDPVRGVLQMTGRGITVAGPNGGERGRAADGGVNITGDVWYYSFPSRTSTNGSFQGGQTKAVAFGGSLPDNTYHYALRNHVEYGGPAGTAATDSDTVSNPTTDAFQLINNGLISGTTFVRGYTYYRSITGGAPYTHRYDVRFDDDGILHLQGMKGSSPLGHYSFDIGTTLTVDPSWMNLSIPIETGTVTLTGAVHDGGDNLAYFSDASADFIADGVLPGFLLTNSTDGSTGTITAVDKTRIACTLSGGTDNDFDNGDTITVTKQWSATEDESGWEPDANISVYISPENWAVASMPAVQVLRSGFVVDWKEPATGRTFAYRVERHPAAA